MTGNLPHTTVGIFNVRGFETAIEQVSQLMDSCKLAILALTETWWKPRKGAPLGWGMEFSSLDQPQQGRGVGGAALLISGALKYKLRLRHVSTRIQCVAIQMGPLTYASMYVSPQSTPRELITVLDTIALNVSEESYWPVT